MNHQCECGKVATWEYVPSTKLHPYYCDDCVPRGCSCNVEYTINSPAAIENGYGEDPPTNHNNWKWIDKGISWVYTDEKGRELPCIEFEQCDME